MNGDSFSEYNMSSSECNRSKDVVIEEWNCPKSKKYYFEHVILKRLCKIVTIIGQKVNLKLLVWLILASGLAFGVLE